MNWHRLFGIMLTDLFSGSPYEVELEKDLSIGQQFLDVVVIRKHPGTFHGRLPDGIDNLADHNLVSFKSYQEPLDAWAVHELIGHYVNYRKQTKPAKDRLFPEDHFGLYGVCARYPNQLAGRIPLTQLQPGVLECNLGIAVRVIVVRDLPDAEHNAPLHLFSADQNKVQYGQGHFEQRSTNSSTLLQELLNRYQQEGLDMPYTLEGFQRESWERILKEMPLEKRLESVPLEKRLEGVPLDKRLEGVPLDKRLEGVPLDKRLEGVPLEKRLEGISIEEIKALLKKLESNQPESNQ